MIEVFKNIGIGVGAVVAVLGLIGGLLALPEKVRRFRTLQRPLGDRGTKYFLLSREDKESHSIAEFLVAEDLMHFLSSYGKLAGGSTTLEVVSVGEFYRVKMQFSPGALDSLIKVKK